jgi:hypothetical protein
MGPTPVLVDEQGVPITYTPTTRRISKGKKGKKVHKCEYPGCGKVNFDSPNRDRSRDEGLPRIDFLPG